MSAKNITANQVKGRKGKPSRFRLVRPERTNCRTNSAAANGETAGTHQKALQINLDPGKYGGFAENADGQEVAWWFFRVGGAAGTIARTISAYDMTVSDLLYRQCDCYVKHSNK